MTSKNPKIRQVSFEDNPSVGVEMVMLRNVSHKAEWQDFLRDAWRQGLLCDMALSTKGQMFLAHKLVLVYHSSFFRKQLLHTTASTAEAVSLDVEAGYLQFVLEYLYEGSIQVFRNDLEGLAKVAEYLSIDHLLQQVREAMRQDVFITSADCLEVWQAALEAGDQDKVVKAQTVALKNFPTLQHSQALTALPADIIKDYLTHKHLHTNGPDERLVAALAWIHKDPETRKEHLTSILNALPLGEMSWFLCHAYADPLIQENAEAKKKVEEALYKPEVPSEVNPQPAQMLPSDSPTKENCLVAFGHRKCGQNDRFGEYSQEVFAVRLDKRNQVVTLGTIGAGVDDCTNCCSYGGYVYASGLGLEEKQIWLFDAQDKSSFRAGELNGSRRRHGLVAGQHGQLYAVGGHIRTTGYSRQTIEAFDLESCKSREVGCLRHWQCPHNLRCCTVTVKEEECLLIAGATDDHHDTTLQLFSPSQAKVTWVLPLGLDVGWINGVLRTDAHALVLGSQATMVIKMEDILSERPEGVFISTRYKVPNQACAVCLHRGTQVVLIGGYEGFGSPSQYHSVYSADLDALVGDLEPGWTPHPGACNMGQCALYGYTNMQLGFSDP